MEMEMEMENWGKELVVPGDWLDRKRSVRWIGGDFQRQFGFP